MRVLLINPLAQFNYKAPVAPLGLLSIATVLKERGHTVKFINRCFDKTWIASVLDSFTPDICGISFISSRSISDGIKVSRTVRKYGIPIVWGGPAASANYQAALETGLCDYVSIGEGELTWLEIVSTLENHGEISALKGLAFIGETGVVTKNEDRPLADLEDLPVLDWSLDDPSRYLHSYLCCKKMTYLYSSKGCPGNCAFCSNPSFHQHRYRKRPTEKVLEEIRFLIENYGLDGVYFSDECWRIKKTDVHEFCEKIKTSGLSFYWGAEARIGLLDKEDLQMMYDCGCRWLFFGIESGSPEMLKRIKKGISLDRIREDIRNCNGVGITSIASVIIGYPEETPSQLMDTIQLMQDLHASVYAVNIFTPIIQSELYNELLAQNKYAPPKDFRSLKKMLLAEESQYRCDTLPLLDLKVIRGFFLWKGFTKKNTTKEGQSYEVAKTAIIDTFHNLTRLGFLRMFPGIFLIAKEFFSVFWYANFYPRIRKKYNLN